MQEQINSNNRQTTNFKYGNKFQLEGDVTGERKKTSVPIWI